MATVVDISELEGEMKEDLPEFIESKLSVKSEREGDKISFEDKSERTHVSAPEIRTYLKRFMHTKEIRKKYRLLSAEGTLKFKKLGKDQVEEEKE
ncbi:MAG: hypothetical protein ACRECH_10555 [Nitrososphaerales archaeon]